MSFKDYLHALRSTSGLVAGVGALVPGFAFFVELDPPLLAGSGVITCAVALAAILIGYQYEPVKRRIGGSLPPLVRQARTFLAWSGVGFLLLMFLFRWTTVLTPRGDRIQIGFGLAEWGLTEFAKQVLSQNPAVTPIELILRTGGLAQGGIDKLWRWWAVALAGSLTLAIFLATFVSWCLGWSLLAKQRRPPREGRWAN